MNDRRLEVINGVYELVCESAGLAKSTPAVIRLPEPKFLGSPVVPILRGANAIDAAHLHFFLITPKGTLKSSVAVSSENEIPRHPPPARTVIVFPFTS